MISINTNNKLFNDPGRLAFFLNSVPTRAGLMDPVNSKIPESWT